MRDFFARFSPLRAIRDLRRFLATRKRHELLLLFPALAITVLILVGFYVDSNIKPAYKPPEIIYVKDWRLDRSDEEIAAQAKIDKAERDKQRAALEKAQAERQEGFKKVDNWLTAHGL